METRPLDEEDMKKIFANPFYAVTFSPSNFGEHEAMVTKEEWKKVNSRLIDELGKDEWLTLLLDVLENGGTAAAAEDGPIR